MAQYAALLYYPSDNYWTTPEELKHAPAYAEFGQVAGGADVLRGGAALHAPATATTITVAGSKGGEVTITDGPYAEAKEVLGGFYLLEAADIDEAIKWGSQIPAAWLARVELRPVVEMDSSGNPLV
jgi:hypothetical protein